MKKMAGKARESGDVEDRKPVVLALVQLPPPVHGQAVMNEIIVTTDFSAFEIQHIRMAFSGSIDEVGRAGLRKIVHLFGIVVSVWFARFKTGAKILYYPPASPNIVPFLRDVVILILCRPLFEKTVFHFHANGLTDLLHKLPLPMKWVFWWAYRRPDLSIVITGRGRLDSETIRSKATKVLPYGIPEPEYAKSRRSLESSATKLPRILFLGMVVPEKGVATLLKACGILARRGIRFDCAIVGRCPSRQLEEEFSRLRMECGVEKLVSFLGPLVGDEKWEEYAAADVFCFPTYYPAESFGLVAVEAMMFGLPVVASDWRGLPEVVDDGETGFLLRPDDVEGFADKLEELLRKPDLRGRMGKAGRRKFEDKYSLETFRAGMEKALSELLEFNR